MKKISVAVLIAGLIFSAACAKKICLTPEVSGPELLKRYQELPRPPVSASFSAAGPQGFFQGELYLGKNDKLQALVFGYLAIGQPLFQLSLENKSFLYLDFTSRTAYSNRMDWLKDFRAGASSDEMPGLIHFLLAAFTALAGNIPAGPENAALSGSLLKVREMPKPGNEIEYVFNKSRLRLVEINQTGDFPLSAHFSYSAGCWFPDQIRAKNQEFQLQINLTRISCPETKPPELKFQPPSGFRQVLVNRPE